MEPLMRPLVGWALAGPCVRPWARGASARVGEPTWSPAQLLRDLEMRLGLPKSEAPSAQRVPIWARRIDALTVTAATKPFYARSFVADSLGTARRLLEWRDALVDAGWNGLAVPRGGDRLDALAALEASNEEVL